MELSDNAMIVLKSRYLKRDSDGKIVETPKQMFRRVANAIADTEEEAADYYGMMEELMFLPNSPTLMNAGDDKGTLSACFVMGLEDSMEGIMNTAKETAMVQKYGGGTGFSLSKLRPKGSPISTTHGKACGPIAVLRHLSSVSRLVTQGGRRDGANMAVMNVHHPDILEFIECKKVEGDIHNFNISVGVTDEFMQSVLEGRTYNTYFNHKVYQELDAGMVFDMIVGNAWNNGEPGIIFIDEVNRNSLTEYLGPITATNPCGEQPLLPYESCNLGSINLSKFVKSGSLDLLQLDRVTRLAVRFLDSVIDKNVYAVHAIEEMTHSTRKIGLGVMGFADMLIQLGISYDSYSAIELAGYIMKYIKDVADSESIRLAEERGAYPVCPDRGVQMRNACRLTVAPTGTISMIAGCSSGIEPLFALSYRKHNILEGKSLVYMYEPIRDMLKSEDLYTEELEEYLADGGSLQERSDLPESIRDLFVTSADVSYESHVRIQAAFQEFVDSGVSKTINLNNTATVDHVRDAYLLAWETGCKGITIYRMGSRDEEVLSVK